MKKIRYVHLNLLLLLLPLINLQFPTISLAQDYDEPKKDDTPPPGLVHCNGVYMSYSSGGREKLYPRTTNATAQAWSFKSTAMIVNTGIEEVKGWQMFVGFHHREIIVSATGAVSSDGDFPVDATNGTTFIGSPNTDLKTSILTAGDYTQISTNIEITGTVFGGKGTATPMPKTIKLTNDGWQCPAATSKGDTMQVCCKRNPKFKAKEKLKTKFMPRQHGDLNIIYDVLQAYASSYMAQVTIDNTSPLGRLDHWNLTWEWMRGEFIYSMRGAYAAEKNTLECLSSKAGQFYGDLDFSQVANCQKKPIIKDLPAERKDDNITGKLPFCCKNGTLLPTHMDPSKSKAIFQLQVYKVPPDQNRTAFFPPRNWKIDGIVNPQYKCGPPIRVDATPFPDPSGLQATTYAIASWQVICNITKPKPKAARCCVSFSAFYNDSAIPCNTCACGCKDIDTDTCNANARPLLLPPDTLLVPFDNRTLKAKVWAKQKHMAVPKKLPCPDNCGISLNWHLNSDYGNGWSARVTLFNWGNNAVEDWFGALDLGKAGLGYENIYSFNGSRIPPKNQTIFFQGLPGMNYLIGITNGTNPARDPQIPGKMQSVISFKKKNLGSLNIIGGDGFPKRVFFNGEECELPKYFPKKSSGKRLSSIRFLPSILLAITTFLAITDRFLTGV
ncbi:COBRA plant [Arabidopsis thaliana x Arabidopsis arenosa]|uniref:COBRA plant n=1 Tax=Arabidopsis thaliana x Arabidopsis arenosa TaxID=1240361 RepID=A0A8T1Y3S8_9BRAS|nr:COBRA plant [Arabidopsis thaliana x Arabidopsis arenosa]